MKLKKILLLVLVAMVTGVPASAQKGAYSSSNKKAIEMYEKGMQCMYRSDIPGAESHFKQAAKADPKFAEPNIMLGEMYEDKRLDSIACVYYYAAVTANPTFYTMAWFRIGELELRQQHYAAAVEAFIKENLCM